MERLTEEDGEEGLKIREYELARRIKLESASVESSLDHQTQLQLGNDAKGRAVTFQLEAKEQDSSKKKAGRRLTQRTSLGVFSRKRYSTLAEYNGKVKKALSIHKNQNFDASRDVPLWFEKICELEGVTEAETVIIQNEVMQNETQMMRMWSKEARGLVQIKAEESELRDFSEIEELQKRNENLEKETIVTWLGVEALAGVINPDDRKQLMARSKGSRIKGEKELLQNLDAKRKDIAFGYFRRSNMRKVELHNTFQEGLTMLNRFGELMENACDNMIQNNKSKLLEELHKHGIEVGRVRSTDATNKLHRKILLNSLDKASGILLTHNDLTMVRLPSNHATWAYVHATDGPWRVKRYDKELILSITSAALQQISMEHATSVDVLRNLAKVLDAVQVSSELKLHEAVIESPQRSRELLQNRLDTIGISFNVDGVSSLLRMRSEVDFKRAVKQVIDKLNDRLEYHGRFYFETHFHRVAATDLPFDYGEQVDEESERQTNNSNNDRDSDKEDDEGEGGDELIASLNRLASQAEVDDDDLLGGVLHDYIEPKEDMWMIGISLDTLTCRGFPGNDKNSFGIRSDGTVWHDGKPRRFCGNLLDEVVVGVLLDLNVGSVSIYAGGALVGVAFGVDAMAYPVSEQMRQGEILRTRHLIPGFALKSKLTQNLDSDSEMEDDEDEDVDENSNEFRFADYEAQGVMSSTSASNYANDAGEEQLNPQFSSTENEESEQWRNDGSIILKTPALSVNFGGYSFSRIPPQTLSCDSYLSFAVEARKAEGKARFAKALKKGLEQQRDGDRALYSMGDTYENQLDENEDDMDPFEKDGLLGSKGVVLGYRNRIAFFNDMQYPKPASWSNFPPQSHRLGYSAATLQRAVRRFLGRKWRQREMFSQALAITMLQRKIRATLPRWRKKKISAATKLQKVWRGKRARNQVKLALRFAKRPDVLDEAATRVQAQFRKHQAENRVRKAAQQAEEEVQCLIGSALRIQKKWRLHKEYEHQQEMAIASRSVLMVQRLWRGLKERRQLAKALGAAKQQELATLGAGVIDRKNQIRAAQEIQRMWRGRADRDYAEMKRLAYTTSVLTLQKAWRSYRIKCQVNALCDSGPAYAVKKFLKIVGALSI